MDNLSVINSFSLNFNEHVPMNPSRLTEAEMKEIVARIPQYAYIVTKWSGVVNANGLNVVVNYESKPNDTTTKAKSNLQKKTQDLIYARKGWHSIEKQVVELLTREGMAVIRLNADGYPVVDSRFRYNIYWNETMKKARYAYKDPTSGGEVAGMTNLEDGGELFVIKHPAYTGYPVPISPVDSALMIARLDFHALVANQKKFDNGMIGQIFLRFNEEMNRKISTLDQQPDDKKNWFKQMMRKLNDTFRGTSNSNQVSSIPGLEDVIEVGGKDNTQMQFYETLKELTPERIAWNWMLTAVDFGTGGSTTYSNASVFNDALYDKVGRSIEQQLAQCLNEWFLPSQGIKTNENYYVCYNEPRDAQKVQSIQSALEEFKYNAITLNEYRAERGLDPLEGGDQFSSQLQAEQPLVERTNVIDAQVQPRRAYRDTGQATFTQALEYRATTVDIAIASADYEGKKGLLASLTKAISKQLKDYVSTLEQVPTAVTLKPIETFYSFPSLKKDLLKFAGQGLELVQADNRTTLSRQTFSFDGEYPKSVLDYIDNQVTRILKGNYEFRSIDIETASQIETIIRANISLGVKGIGNKILEQIEDISQARAELIAQTEVAQAVEGTRYIMYRSDPLFDRGGKQWLTSVDERVRPLHTANAGEGIIPIDKAFSNGFVRAGTEPRCRCDTVYYTADEM